MGVSGRSREGRAHPPAGPRRLLAIVLACAAVTLAVATLPGAANAAGRAAMVIDANTGAVLYAVDADEPRFPASLTKIMTLYLTFELIEKGRLAYTDRIAISAQAAAQPPSKLDLDAGDTILVRDAVRALVTKSANDIAVALAEHIGGSETNFARLMTKKAREIGMSRTTFRNASGLPHDEQTTTARDMLTLALRLQDDFPSHYGVFSTRQFSFKGATFRSHNTLLYHYQGTDGIKTGYTRASGFNLVSSVRRDGRHLVGAVFGGNTAGSRNAQMRAMLDRAFAKASSRRTRRKEPLLIAEPERVKRPSGWATTASAAALPAPAAAGDKAGPAKAARPPASAVIAKMPTAAAAETAAPASSAAVVMAAAAPADDISSRISIARVRPLSIAALAAEPARRRAADDPIAAQIEGAIVPRASADAPLAVREPVPEPVPERPAAVEPEVSGRSPAARDGAELGRPPSTLHEQLSRILASNGTQGAADGPAPPTYNLRGPADVGDTVAVPPPDVIQAGAAPVATSPLMPQAVALATRAEPTPGALRSSARGGYLVQVGAFNTAEEARRRLSSVREQLSGMLAAADPVTEPVAKGDRQFYRARFAGFDQTNATAVCNELRRRSIDCLVARAQ